MQLISGDSPYMAVGRCGVVAAEPPTANWCELRMLETPIANATPLTTFVLLQKQSSLAVATFTSRHLRGESGPQQFGF